MTDEWILSVTDVAEALGWTRDDVLGVISSGELRTLPGNRIRVAHHDVRAFVALRQRDALDLGVEPGLEPSLLASQPLPPVDHHDDAS